MSGHDERHAEIVSLHVLNALPADEAAAAEARIAACADCRDELAALRPVVASFAAWPTNVLRPAAPLWTRLSERIAAESGQPVLPPAPPQGEAPWPEVAPGISCKILSTDTQTGRVAMLVRLAPGTPYPPHRHSGVEELHLLDGELFVDGRKLHPGDYLRSEAETVDSRVLSERGCTCVLLTSVADVIL